MHDQLRTDKILWDPNELRGSRYPPAVPIRLLILVVLAGCPGSSSTLPTPPATAKPFATSPPLAAPGEHMAYKLSLGGLELAVYDLTVGEVTTIDSKQAIVVQGHAKAVGLVKMVANIDDKFTSYVDTTTGRPLRFLTDEFATKSEDVEHSVAAIDARAGDSVPVEFHLNDKPPVPEPQKVSLPDVWDYNAFLIALRSWEGPPGTKIIAEVFRSRFLWHVEMTIRDKSKLVTDLGEFPALRLDGHTYKVDKKGVKQPDSDERDFSVWISDDAGRVPLKINTRTDYGDVAMSITDYQAGK